VAQAFLLAYSYELDDEINRLDAAGSINESDQMLRDLKLVKISYMVSIAFAIITVGVSSAGYLKLHKNQSIVDSVQTDSTGAPISEEPSVETFNERTKLAVSIQRFCRLLVVFTNLNVAVVCLSLRLAMTKEGLVEVWKDR